MDLTAVLDIAHIFGPAGALMLVFLFQDWRRERKQNDELRQCRTRLESVQAEHVSDLKGCIGACQAALQVLQVAFARCPCSTDVDVTHKADISGRGPR